MQQLLDDVTGVIDAVCDKEYSVGMVLISGDQKNHFELIDGQQRLTTLLAAFAHYGTGSKVWLQHETINGSILTNYTSSEGDIKTS
ncbi:MAG: DUF262 domain-containing protein [Pirellulales bacterium]